MDILTYTVDNIYWYEQITNLVFTQHIIPVVNDPYDLHIIDWDLDGDQDIITGATSILLNNGQQEFIEGTIFNVNYAEFDVGQWNATDHVPDMVNWNLVDPPNGFEILLQQRNFPGQVNPVVLYEGFYVSNPPPFYYYPISFDLADIDNQGGDDVVGAMWESANLLLDAHVFVWRQYEPFVDCHQTNGGQEIWNPALADFNADGYTDYVYYDWDGNRAYYLLLNSGYPNYNLNVDSIIGSQGTDMESAHGDMDGDGDIDLVYSRFNEIRAYDNPTNPGPLALRLVPIRPHAAPGGQIAYGATVFHAAPDRRLVQVRMRAIGPNGENFPLLASRFYLDPSQPKDFNNLTLDVPAWAEPGSYSLICRVKYRNWISTTDTLQVYVSSDPNSATGVSATGVSTTGAPLVSWNDRYGFDPAPLGEPSAAPEQLQPALAQWAQAFDALPGGAVPARGAGDAADTDADAFTIGDDLALLDKASLRSADDLHPSLAGIKTSNARDIWRAIPADEVERLRTESTPQVIGWTDINRKSVFAKNPPSGTTSSAPLSDDFRVVAFPNPFNSSISITVSLPTSVELTITVYDILGREVATLAKGAFSAGNHQFALSSDGLASGLYFIHATVPGQLDQVQKVMLVR
ncbi:T9SS type A sorting domain-containing protein [bacterium]|nr:T9SS type A sorting domain-containing protein [bacterium]